MHDDGFGVRRGSDGDLSFTTPSGIPVPEHPTWLRPDETPAPTLAAKEPLAQWDGQRLDLNYAVSVLLSRRSYVHDRRGRQTAA